MALNCFKLKETNLGHAEEILDGQITIHSVVATKVHSQQPVIEDNFSPDDVGSMKSGKIYRKPATHTEIQHARLPTPARHPGFHTSTFSSCIPTKSNARENTCAGLENVTIGNSAVQAVSPECDSRAAESNSPGVHLCQSHIAPQTAAGKTRAFGCLVRSQSDSTCLSVKTQKSAAATGRNKNTNVDDGHSNVADNNPQVDDVPYDSLSSIEDTSTLDPLHSSSSEMDAYPVDLKLNTSSSFSNRPGFYDSISSCVDSPVESDATKTFRTVPTTRSYQLVCRDGVQSYEVVTSTYACEPSLGSDCNVRLSDDSCASPNLTRKQLSEISIDHDDNLKPGKIGCLSREVFPSPNYYYYYY